MRLDEIAAIRSEQMFRNLLQDQYGVNVKFIPDDEAVLAVDADDDEVVYGIWRNDLGQGEIYDRPLTPGGTRG